MTFFRMLAVAAVTTLSVMSAYAADHEVKMLNRGSDGTPMVFEPAFLRIEVGDTVTFVPTDKSHNAETINDLLPEGATPFKGKLNQQITVTFDVEGTYAYKCQPHFGMGMVGLILVGGDTVDAETFAEARMPPRAKATLEGLAALSSE